MLESFTIKIPAKPCTLKYLRRGLRFQPSDNLIHKYLSLILEAYLNTLHRSMCSLLDSDVPKDDKDIYKLFHKFVCRQSDGSIRLGC